ncbi:sigma-w pathway protein ysdB [Virgibacillus xinjiangensis]|uniref:Sigma-w pathway protein ysdB n=1 Tax=Virgibacillus xinjiangensis TaxID=393090 RepID=A0ABV7CUP5_9BACI
MIVIVFRLLMIIALVLIVYTIAQYLRNPQRKLRIAQEEKEFYFADEPENSKRNIQIAYKGCLFDGEKYLGTTEEAFEVVNIHVSVRDSMDLQGMTRDDLYFLEQEILLRYPHAKVVWKHPISELLLTDMK